jgi:hypothetical protein
MVFGLVHLAWIASVRGDSARAGGGGPQLERSRLDGRGLAFERAVDEALS